MSYNVLVMDHEAVVRRGIVAQLAATEFKVAASTGCAKDAIEKVHERHVDVIVMDFKLPGEDGFAFLRERLSWGRRIPLLIFSACQNPIFINRMFELKANGFLVKSSSPKKLVCCLRQIVVGESLWTREQMRKIAGSLNAKRLGLTINAALTYRECDVLRGMCSGMTNKEIAQKLAISYETVKEHVQHILRKIGVTDRTQAAVWAVRKGIANNNGSTQSNQSDENSAMRISNSTTAIQIPE